MNRRTFLKAGSLAVLSTLAGHVNIRQAKASSTAVYNRIVVFGVDGLRYDFCKDIHGGGLERLNPPILALSGGGLSVTQPGWADIWTGLPSYWHGARMNDLYSAMPEGLHIMGKLITEGFTPVWVTGKDPEICGDIPESPHYELNKYINLDGNRGLYKADVYRNTHETWLWGKYAIEHIQEGEYFCMFIHFQDPDKTGHQDKDPQTYLQAARTVDAYIADLMDRLPPDTAIIYCSDHGFNFELLGECESTHTCAPDGMLASNVEFKPNTTITTRPAIGRLIYKLAGFDPDHLFCGEPHNRPYKMYGLDLI